MSGLDQLLIAARFASGVLDAEIPSGWMQGRTTYGGLTAALTLDAARRHAPDLPPLTAATIAFLGPVGERASLHATTLRRGRSVSSIGVDAVSGGSLAARATFMFAAARASALAQAAAPAPFVPAPGNCAPFFADGAPAFAANFDYALASGAPPVSGAASADNLVWVRFRKPPACDATVALLALADALPPAIMSRFASPAPISTVTWSIVMATPAPATQGGWWLIRATSEFAIGGMSGQRLAIWNDEGAPVLLAQQAVAIFA